MNYAVCDKTVITDSFLAYKGEGEGGNLQCHTNTYSSDYVLINVCAC